MKNPFDQFDAVQPQAGANPFDQFDAPSNGIAQDFQKRLGNSVDINQRYAAGDINAPHAILKQTGQVAGLANDAVSRGMQAITPDFVEQQMARDFGGAGQYLDRTIGQTMVGKTVKGAAQEVGQFLNQNPNLKEDLGAVGNLGMMMTGAKPVANAMELAGRGGVKAAVMPVKGAINEAADLTRGFKARGIEELEQAADAIKSRSSRAYADMRNIGATFTPQANAKIAKDVRDALFNSGKLNQHLHGKIMGITDDFVKEMQTGAVDLEGLDQWRRLFGEVAGNFNDPDSARRASFVMDAIDDAVDNLNPSSIANGSKDAVDALNLGRQEWQRYKKFDSIAQIVKKSDGDANYLKRELKKFADNPKKMRGFNASEVSALQDAARNSGTEGIYKMLGKFGIDIGNSRLGNTALPAVGGLVAGGMYGAGTGAALPVAGTAARYGQKLKARSKVENLLQEIEK